MKPLLVQRRRDVVPHSLSLASGQEDHRDAPLLHSHTLAKQMHMSVLPLSVNSARIPTASNEGTASIYQQSHPNSRISHGDGCARPGISMEPSARTKRRSGDWLRWSKSLTIRIWQDAGSTAGAAKDGSVAGARRAWKQRQRRSSISEALAVANPRGNWGSRGGWWWRWTAEKISDKWWTPQTGWRRRLQHLCLRAMLSGQSTPSTFFHLHITCSTQKITVTLSIVPP
jgi:hypothetical protein